MAGKLVEATELREPIPDIAIQQGGRIVRNCKLGLDICPAGAVSGGIVHCFGAARKVVLIDQECQETSNSCPQIIYESRK